MPLLAQTLETALLNNVYVDGATYPSDPATLANNWAKSIFTYISSATVPPMAITVANGAYGTLVSELTATFATPDSNLRTTFAPVDKFLNLVGQASAGSTAITGLFGDYAFDGIDSIKEKSGAAAKVASNVDTKLLTFVYTNASGATSTWS